MLRVAKDLRGSALLCDHALVHKDHAIGNRARKGHLMRDHHHGHTLCRQLAHSLKHLAHNLGVKGAGGLVEQHDLGVHAQRAGDGDALLLTTGQLGYGGVGKICQANGLQMVHGGLLGLLLGSFFQRDRRQGAVVQHVHVVEQVESLEHHANVLAQLIHVHMVGGEVGPLEPHVAGVRRFKQIDAAQKGSNLPEPDAPMMVTTSPGIISRFTSRKTSRSPKGFTQPLDAHHGLSACAVCGGIDLCHGLFLLHVDGLVRRAANLDRGHFQAARQAVEQPRGKHGEAQVDDAGDKRGIKLAIVGTAHRGSGEHEVIKSIPGVTDVMTREIVSVNLNGTRFPADIVSKKGF